MKIVHNAANFEFLLLDDHEKCIGEITYVVKNEREWCVTHTGVRQAYEGQGYAGQLLDALTECASAAGVTIIPLCSYVAQAFRRKPLKYAAVIKNA